MLIANPIYDVVFKYLMDDSKIAKLFISTIIGMEVLELEVRPQELVGDVNFPKKSKKKNKPLPEITNLAVYRLDFGAKVKTPEGEQLVIIEIQKAKLLNDIMRFRKYLGKQYSDVTNTYLYKNKKQKNIRAGIPIISIYFLGEELDSIRDIPVIVVNNQPYDLYSGKQIEVKDVFIDSLTHKSYIIPIPYLSAKRRNELEILLSIFDQSNSSSDIHILNVDDSLFPKKFQEIVKRLRLAVTEPKMRDKMQIEDDFISELSDYERLLFEKDKNLDEEKKQRKEAERLAKKLAEEVEEIEKQKQEVEKQKQEAEDKLQKRSFTIIEKCLKKGMNIEETAEIVSVSIKEVIEVAKKLKLNH